MFRKRPVATGVAGHLERHLGPLGQAWRNETHAEVAVVLFADTPWEDVQAVATVGLSRTPLAMPGGRKVRHEWVLPFAGLSEPSRMVALLMFLSAALLELKSSPGRGQAIRLPLELHDELGFQAIYCSAPTFLDDAFAVLAGDDPPTVFIWAIPIYTDEADFIAAAGWEAFETRLEAGEPDLFLLGRPSILSGGADAAPAAPTA